MNNQQSMKFDRYAESHKTIKGPGDGRPTALQIIKDENLEGQLSDKIILVTGGSSGIGIETVRALAHTGAKVIVGVRNLPKGQKVLDDIVQKDKELKQEQFELLEMDLNSLDSVRKSAEMFMSKHTQLNILVNNAGIGGVPPGKTADGHESHFGVNHLSHFLLFRLLQPTLLASSTTEFASRIVIVSSLIHRFSPALLDDPNLENVPYDPATAYASSKTANILFSNEVERRYGNQGLHAISLHPGGIMTGLQDHHDPRYLEQMQEMTKDHPEVWQTMKSIEQGAATTVLAAVGKVFEGKGALYLDDCQIAPLHNMATDPVAAPGYAQHAFDEAAGKRLWEISLGMVGIKE